MVFQSRLRKRLVLAVAAAFIAILAVQAIIRFGWTLPQLNQLAHYNDQQDVVRIKNKINQQLALHQSYVYDNAVWDISYLMATNHNADWFKENFFIEQSFIKLNINGIYFYDAQGQVIIGLSTTHDFKTLDTPEFRDPQLIKSLLITPDDVAKNKFLPITKTQFISVLGKPAVVISQSFAPTDEYGPSKGTMLVWRYIDNNFIDTMAPNESDKIQLHQGEQLTEIFKHLSSEVGSNEINANVFKGRLFIGVRDQNGNPLLAFSSEQSPRLYNQDLLDSSMVAGLGMAIFILLLIYRFISVSIIQPILKILRVVSYVSHTNDYTLRTDVKGNNEIHRLGQLIDQLLAIVEKQKKTLQQQNERLEALSNTDPLTGLANRRYLDSYLGTLSTHTANQQLPLSLIVIDIDYFKSFNDSFGHSEGDRILRQVAAALTQLTHGATDLVCRFGGEEFVVVLENTDKDAAAHVAKNLCHGIESLKITHGGKGAGQYVTISIGVATKQAHHNIDTQHLFELADASLYEAKQQGRNRYVMAFAE